MKFIHKSAMPIPTLQTLRALDAAARLGSYTSAAEALGLTHGAVSHRIRALEAELGTTLFVRQGNGMVATPAAMALLVPVREALDLLTLAFPASRPARLTLRVSMLPSFASRWLTPRLRAFRSAHPHIDLRIDARLELAEIGPNGVDCAIRYGVGDWRDVRAERLAGERLFPVCAPGYATRRGLETPADLASANLLRHDRQLWKPWLRAAGLDWPEPRDGALFADSGLLLDAAIAGEGVALARERLAESDIASGRLTRLFDIAAEDKDAYYFVRGLDAGKAAVDQFADWIARTLG
ncbi:MAG: LysR substrate-binding domain-containing protein [Phenylobacterium sp.]